MKASTRISLAFSFAILASGCASNEDLAPLTKKRIADYPECNINNKTYGVYETITMANHNTVANKCMDKKEKEKILKKNPICKSKFEISHIHGVECSNKIEREKREAIAAEKKRLYMESPEGKAEIKLKKEAKLAETKRKKAAELAETKRKEEAKQAAIKRKRKAFKTCEKAAAHVERAYNVGTYSHLRNYDISEAGYAYCFVRYDKTSMRGSYVPIFIQIILHINSGEMEITKV